MGKDRKQQRFDRVIMPHLDAAYNLARWLIRNPDDAEDVMQNALMRAYKSLDFCREDSARQWLVRITRNVCYDWLTVNQRLPKGFADVDCLDQDGANYTHDAFGQTVATPEELMQRQRVRDRVNDMIAALPPVFREVVVLRELEDFSYHDIAEILGVPVGTVMSRLSRARAAMIKQWDQDDE